MTSERKQAEPSRTSKLDKRAARNLKSLAPQQPDLPK